MTPEHEKIAQYLGEAHAMERALVRVLQEQVAVTPTGAYRDALDRHLHETVEHAERVRRRLGELDGGGESPLGAAGILLQSLLGQALALAKTPLDLVRGTGGEEKVLKNAKDTAATEALEIATYTAIERLATDLGDAQTARLAREIRADEERMLDEVLEQIPQLTGKVVAADVRGNGTYDIAKTGAGQAAHEAADTARDAASNAVDKARAATRRARAVPGVTAVEGEVKGVVASASDLPLAGYDDLTAEDIVKRLPQLSQIDLGKIDGYERLHDARTTVLDRVQSLRGDEPWPGYDEQTVPEIRRALSAVDADRALAVAEYERRHKDRAGVLSASEAAAAA